MLISTSWTLRKSKRRKKKEKIKVRVKKPKGKVRVKKPPADDE